ncbi:MAG: polyhydroxyalkanoate synthesis repressor PhaR, partial [Pseudomonadota bacterium]
MARHKGDGPIIIKKYANRRLYDTSTSSYVTLDHLSELVRSGADFEVRDAKTGEDLTRSVLTQIIYENETKGEGALPLNFLRQLIGFYGGGAQSMLPAWLDMSMNQFAEAQERWRTAMGGATPMALFEKQAQRNMAMFENAMKMFNPAMAATDTKLDDGDTSEMH